MNIKNTSRIIFYLIGLVLMIGGLETSSTQKSVAIAKGSSTCVPRTGWELAHGAFDKETAVFIQSTLQQAGVTASVKVQPYGEKDSCATFYQQGTGVEIRVNDHALSLEELAMLFDTTLAPYQAITTDHVRVIIEDSTTSVYYLNKNIDGIPSLLDAEATIKNDRLDFAPLTAVSSPQYSRKVLVVSLNPRLSNGQLLTEFKGWFDYRVLAQETANFFYTASNGRLHYQIVEEIVVEDGWPEKIDGFVYSEEEYLSVLNGTVPAHNPDRVNYTKLVNDPLLDICGKANRGEIDEVWVYNGPYFGFYESVLVGPDAYYYNSSPVPEPWDCTRTIPIMGPSPERRLDASIHNFGHRMESTMTQVYGSWQQNSMSHGWEKFGLVDAQSVDFDFGGCGSTHYPPNALADYEYSRSDQNETICDDFVHYPNLGAPAEVIEIVDCSTWGCEEVGYHHYWFSHLPRNGGCDADAELNDWWLYFSTPATAVNEIDCTHAPIFGLFLPLLRNQ